MSWLKTRRSRSPILTYTRPLQMPTKKNIMEMLNQVSDSQPANDVMMSPSLDFDEARAATMLAETPLAETLTDDDVQAVKGLL